MDEDLKKFSGMFDDRDLKLLESALEAAWAKAQSSGAYFAEDSEKARAILAKHMIRMAKGGERNPAILSEGALIELANRRNRL